MPPAPSPVSISSPAPTTSTSTRPSRASYDSLSALEDWTEDGKAPSRPVVTDAGPAGNARTRPLCAFPSWPEYRGHGNPASAHSFTCHGARPRA
ncbi:tannase/feruloyl esterase family alpha/beta hydrolase [Streptomyces sp. NPDC018019]|uniref:tannase/feruloyl esterase family alpha/beta hydrolase n=1 Tax=Streptomyces sp. NPDC018019 TaxID=3365030 RepID=UPI00379D4CED